MGSRTRIVWGITALIVLGLGLATWSRPIPLFLDDYGQYLRHAQAILAGRPYADTGYLFTPYRPFAGPPIASPGLPLTLVPLLAIFGPTLVAFKALTFLSLAVFLVLAGRRLTMDDSIIAAGGTLMAGTSLLLSLAPNYLGSDLMFAALCWGLILLADQPDGWRWQRAALFTVVGIVALAYRLVAVAIVPAGFLYFLVHRRRTGWWPLVFLPIFALTFLVQYKVLGVGTYPPAPPEIVPLIDTPTTLWALLARNVWYYRLAIFTSHLYPFAGKAPNAVYHIVAAALALIGGVTWAKRSRASFALILSATYIALLIAVGVIGVRYAWPLFPIGAYAFLLGVATVVGWIGAARYTRVVAFAAATCVSAFAIYTHYTAMPQVPSVEDPAVQDLFSRVREIRAQCPSARFASFGPRSLTWFTDTPAMPLFLAPDAPTLAELDRQRITHVVVGDLGLDSALTRHWQRLVETHPADFHIATQNDAFAIYRHRLGGGVSSVPCARQ